MQINDEHLKLLAKIQQEWNRAEGDIKTAEQVVNNIVIPSVKELRYAGRRIVDALCGMASESPDTNTITALLNDACFDCHRARHDAVDAATSKIAIDIDIMIEKLQYEAILQVFPSFPSLVSDLRKIRTKIVESRRSRENREAIYSLLEENDFLRLVGTYNTMRESEHMMKAIAGRNRRNDFLSKWGVIIGLIGGIAATAALFLSLKG